MKTTVGRWKLALAALAALAGAAMMVSVAAGPAAADPPPGLVVVPGGGVGTPMPDGSDQPKAPEHWCEPGSPEGSC